MSCRINIHAKAGQTRRLVERPVIPCFIASCGSFNPITSAHIMLLKVAKDTIESKTDFPDGCRRKVIYGFVSPVNDAYKKPGLAGSPLRKKLCSAAFETSENSWLEVHEWESEQNEFVPTFNAMNKMREDVKNRLGGPESEQSQMLEGYFCFGADLLESFYKPGCWNLDRLIKLIEDFNVVVLKRAGSTCPSEVIKKGTELNNFNPVISNETKYPGTVIDFRKFIHKFVFAEMPPNDTSSTLVRNTLKDEGIDALAKLDVVPKPVLEILKTQDFYPVKK